MKPNFSDAPKERIYDPITREGAVRRNDEHADGVGVASATEVSKAVDVARTETVTGLVDVVFVRISEVRVEVTTDVAVVVIVCVVVRLMMEV